MNFRQRLTIIQKSDLQNIEFKKKKKTKKTDFESPNEHTSLNNLVVSQMLAK